ncbi:TPA: transcription elongation factor GreA [Candidatus Berkelbacteria bacterium]|uniref:Transcription elongation factor GreA n=1 Tax=Berkelbacteria bacterium GW2011_GWE1_39_12 TaxID=1618337 RepID=A0A0G4B646_9BACT|nr:MAG: transcription elongation factor GreA, transcription elongation factor GreA [Berkelbacteria bacterium GW2011_GWE1_39_12]HBO60422.1 transcription elongation factor GreA [Candidatus Berkelbacteria bacterium]
MFLTQSGLQKLKEELAALKGRRKEIAERIKTAREFGDLSENSEYEDARNEQSFVEGRIQELDEMIKTAKVVVKNGGDKAELGSIVTIDMSNDKVTYELVGANESDPSKGKISIESPIGHSLLGHIKGEKIQIHLPSGILDCKILDLK